MPTCVICLEALKTPAALPCGHVFCFECLVKLVRNVQPYVNHHFCPTCRHPYTITVANPALVPPHLQHHVTPSIRRLCLDYSLPKPKTSLLDASASEPLAAECARLRAENASLKSCCDVWSTRARLHAGTTLGLIGLIRLSRGQGPVLNNSSKTDTKNMSQKEDWEKKFTSLKRTIDEIDEKVSHQCCNCSDRSVHRDSDRVSVYRTPILSPSTFCPPSPSLSGSDDLAALDCEECQRTVKRRRSEPIEPLSI